MILRWLKSKQRNSNSIEIKNCVNGDYFLTLQKFLPGRTVTSVMSNNKRFVKSKWIDIPIIEK